MSEHLPEEPPQPKRKRLSEKTFRRELINELMHIEHPLIEYGRRYHTMCDEFDDANLTGDIVDGIRLPSNVQENKLMMSHVRAVQATLRHEIASMGLDPAGLTQAIVEASKEKR